MPFDADGPVTTVPVTALRAGWSPRRAGENLDHVQVLADAPDELPPIIVRRADLRVVDGMHRLRAARLRGEARIAVRFFDGDDQDAFVLAVRTNVTHGLPLSLADRKAAAERIVTSHPHWSDRMIATTSGLSAATVARVRRAHPDLAPDIRVGHDGKVRPVNSMERRRVARAILLAEPALSLREVARRAGISPETARSVRRRLPQEPAQDPTRRRSFDEPVPAGPLVRQLRGDPTLRFSETGRTLLRLLEVRSVPPEMWAAIAANMPAHWRDAVARVAMECADTWRGFAEQLLGEPHTQTG
ncbi:ParB/RepB/Spo0J family partition protein [Actinophytocola sp.]|uniref:ParB/RepB/Spo0J family partition protein n=1 Tax=Actinophytocola sp. TaxID=1872138 RepID=UPI003899A591